MFKWATFREILLPSRNVAHLNMLVHDMINLLYHQEAIEEKDAAQAIQYENVDCKHKEMCIKPSYKNVKIPSPILKQVMFHM